MQLAADANHLPSPCPRQRVARKIEYAQLAGARTGARRAAGRFKATPTRAARVLRQLNVQRPGRGYSQRIGTEKQEIALLRILIASAERAIEAFQASANINDVDLLADLERVVERSRNELAALTERGGTADPA